jgi:DNA-binding transcriptional ArsR family regulator
MYNSLVNVTTPGDPVSMLSRPDQVAAALSPLRRRILEQFDEPQSAATLARRLGMPRQKLNYHLRGLEKAGLLELAETRRRRGCTERLLRRTARAWVVSPELLGRLSADPATVRDKFSSAFLVATASRLLRQVGELRARASAARKKLATFTLQTEVRFRSAAERAAFASELTDAVAALVERYHDERAPEGRTYSFVVAGHPKPDPGTPEPTGDPRTANDPRRENR